MSQRATRESVQSVQRAAVILCVLTGQRGGGLRLVDKGRRPD